jgi:hypothetical protein
MASFVGRRKALLLVVAVKAFVEEAVHATELL